MHVISLHIQPAATFSVFPNNKARFSVLDTKKQTQHPRGKG